MKCTPEKNDELKSIIQTVSRYQGKIADRVFCNRYRKFVGTARLWRDRLLIGDFVEVDVERRLHLLHELLSLLEGGTIPDTFYAEIPFNKIFQQGVAQLEGQRDTDRRIFCVLADIGVGKTVSAKVAVREQNEEGYRGPKRVLIIVPEAIRENKIGLLRIIAKALGRGETAVGAAALMDELKAALSEDIVLFFDEAHQGGVMLMRVIKDLVNQTRAHFVYVALKTEYIRVVGASSGNIVEAKQFVRRCMQPVFMAYASGTKALIPARSGKDLDGDATILLQRRTSFARETCRAIAVEKIESLQLHGNLSTLSDAIDLAEADADERGCALAPDAVRKAIEQICDSH